MHPSCFYYQSDWSERPAPPFHPRATGLSTPTSAHHHQHHRPGSRSGGRGARSGTGTGSTEQGDRVEGLRVCVSARRGAGEGGEGGRIQFQGGAGAGEIISVGVWIGVRVWIGPGVGERDAGDGGLVQIFRHSGVGRDQDAGPDGLQEEVGGGVHGTSGRARAWAWATGDGRGPEWYWHGVSLPGWTISRGTSQSPSNSLSSSSRLATDTLVPSPTWTTGHVHLGRFSQVYPRETPTASSSSATGAQHAYPDVFEDRGGSHSTRDRDVRVTPRCHPAASCSSSFKLLLASTLVWPAPKTRLGRLDRPVRPRPSGRGRRRARSQSAVDTTPRGDVGYVYDEGGGKGHWCPARTGVDRPRLGEPKK